MQNLGEKVTEISLDAIPGITEKVPTEQCINIWMNKSDAHLGKKENKTVYGLTMNERLDALKNSEQMYLALLFQRGQFTLDEFKKQMGNILEGAELDTYIDVVTELYNGTKNNRFVRSILSAFCFFLTFLCLLSGCISHRVGR